MFITLHYIQSHVI